MTDDRKDAMLTSLQRDFLTGEHEYTGEHAKQERYQRRKAIRERIYHTLLDFTLLLDHLDASEREKVFGGPMEAFIGFEDSEFEKGLRDTLAFILYGAGVTALMKAGGENLHEPTAERLLEDALYRAGKKAGDDSRMGPFLVEDLELRIDAARIPVPNLIGDLEEGRELHPAAVRMLLEMDEVDMAPIQEQLRKMLLDDTSLDE